MRNLQLVPIGGGSIIGGANKYQSLARNFSPSKLNMPLFY